MNVLIIPNSFKGSLSAVSVAKIAAKGILKVKEKLNYNLELIPISDGGDGLIDAFLFSKRAKKVECIVSDPLNRKIKTHYAYDIKNSVAILEMASASGLVLLNNAERNPLTATSKGTGELLLNAMKKAKKIIIGIGGSATCDCGVGALSALGFQFLNHQGEKLEPLAKNLSRIQKILYPCNFQKFSSLDIQIAYDVKNPLIGKNGAARVYSPQKGASPEDVLFLERGLANFAKVIKERTGIDISHMRGAGAAGGIGAAFHALLGAKLRPGTQIVFRELQIEEKIKNADLIITGEGRIDFQTIFGKAPIEVAKIAKKYKLPCIALCGSLEPSVTSKLYKKGLTAVFSICTGPSDIEFCIKNAEILLGNITEQLFKTFTSLLISRRTKRRYLF
ncbi:MAG TPA: glycerate kinase [Victivallales bacterium]|nr:glycerate kinase [Victivallales bacterium]HRR28578.1 glycerate kinase [Victivallales bacterium]